VGVSPWRFESSRPHQNLRTKTPACRRAGDSSAHEDPFRFAWALLVVLVLDRSTSLGFLDRVVQLVVSLSNDGPSARSVSKP
jgi:hypothetical protein